MRVKAYWNLHRKLWSIQHRGRVIGHTPNAILSDVEFKVSEAGRQRVLRERRKHVHAYAVGNLVSSVESIVAAAHGGYERISYNPYKAGTFVNPDGHPVANADFVSLSVDVDKKGRVEAKEAY